MRLTRLSIRTLMIVVAITAFLMWGGRMGARSLDYHRRSTYYSTQAANWRELATRNHPWKAFRSQCAEYFTALARKYRRASWRPWLPVDPDPYAPGAREAEQAASRKTSR
ncbi:hypothetical protein ACYOEI_25510 [Singulisphaera rosea]